MTAWHKHIFKKISPLNINHTQSNKEALKLFTENKKIILEINAGIGETAAAAKKQFAGIKYYAFEENKAAAEKAKDKANIDYVIKKPFTHETINEELTGLNISKNTIDGVLLNDSLSKMHDPWHALTALLPFLHEKSEIILTLPNIRNLWIMNEIAEGRFHYQTAGAMDINRIRFFTMAEIAKLIKSTGYEINYGGVILDDNLQDFFNSTQINTKGARGACVFHYKNISVKSHTDNLTEYCTAAFLLKISPQKKYIKKNTFSPEEAALQFAKDYDNAYLPDNEFYAPSLPPLPPPQPNNLAPNIKLYAFYLPQFHPTHHNNKWWGEGFTEWTNVARARPAFDGHYQPRHPAELGYYDLRVPEIMKRQVELAKQAGLSGFIFYYYWFSGERMLEKPLFDFMNRYKELDFPFMVMWCNENWRKSWVDEMPDSARPANDLLLGHKHLENDPEKFIEDLKDILTHPKYTKIDNKPVLLIYPLFGVDGTIELNQVKENISRWRAHAKKIGIGDIYIGAHEKSDFINKGQSEFIKSLDIDFFFEFPPPNSITYEAEDFATGIHTFYKNNHNINIIYYETLIDKIKSQPPQNIPLIKTVIAGAWDNTARKGEYANIFHNANPKLYEKWLKMNADFSKNNPVLGENIVFINAWNEWAEGAYLEPDRKYGYAYLKATQRVAYNKSEF